MTKSTSLAPILVTTALPYANGPIHLGHLVEYIQADCWVRARRMESRGEENSVTFVCADDAHGTAVMLRAEAEGVTAENLIEGIRLEHHADFQAFGVAFDHYHSTHSPENQAFASSIYQSLKEEGLIDVRSVEQYYDNVKGLFLPDRFIKGTCPKCKTADQYGDACEACGAAYSPTDLINPYSTISKSTPTLKLSDHYFFKLSDPRCRDFLREWSQSNTLQTEAANKINEWLGEATDESGFESSGLADWDISRDAPYFGFEIPHAPGKYFYVWLDAPIGYMASFAHWMKMKNGSDINDHRPEHLRKIVESHWGVDSSAELYHFIGKDILYFHALFWPAMLKFSGYRTPTSLFVHGFLTVNGQKMSKSRGTFITARQFLQSGINPEYLRYFFASRLSPKIEDIDLGLADFEQKINSDLIGKTVNIASRSAPFLQKLFHNQLISENVTEDFYNALPEFLGMTEEVRIHYQEREFSKAVRRIMQAADNVNQYCDMEKPWELAKRLSTQDDLHARAHLHKVCSQLINAFRLLVLALKPIMPHFSEQAETFLKVPPLMWKSADQLLPIAHRINPYQHLLKRLEPALVDKLTIQSPSIVEVSSKAPAPANHSKKENMNTATTSLNTNTVSIDDFAKLDLRIAVIESAAIVEGSDKLVKLIVNLGKKADETEDRRTIFAGIRAHYASEKLVGKKVVVVANLAPRKMRFGVSEGMVLAASFANDDGGVFVIEPEGGSQSLAQAGMKVK